MSLTLSDIEDGIATGELSAAFVFTQMKQHIQAERNAAIDAAMEIASESISQAEVLYRLEQLKKGG